MLQAPGVGVCGEHLGWVFGAQQGDCKARSDMLQTPGVGVCREHLGWVFGVM